MDAMPVRQAQHMAWWTMAGSVGALAGPVLVAACLGAGLGWRAAILVVAACGLVAWVAIALAGQPGPGPGKVAAGEPASASDAEAGLAGGAGPLALGLLAQRLRLGWAMAVLCLAPVCMLTVPGRTASAGTSGSARLSCRD